MPWWAWLLIGLALFAAVFAYLLAFALAYVAAKDDERFGRK